MKSLQSTPKHSLRQNVARPRLALYTVSPCCLRSTRGLQNRVSDVTCPYTTQRLSMSRCTGLGFVYFGTSGSIGWVPNFTDRRPPPGRDGCANGPSLYVPWILQLDYYVNLTKIYSGPSCFCWRTRSCACGLLRAGLCLLESFCSSEGA